MISPPSLVLITPSFQAHSNAGVHQSSDLTGLGGDGGEGRHGVCSPRYDLSKFWTVPLSASYSTLDQNKSVVLYYCNSKVLLWYSGI